MKDLQLFNFGDAQIRTSLDVEGTVWFVAKDIAEILGYPETKNALALCKKLNSSPNAELNKINGLAPATKWIPESDMFRLIMRSNKQEAETFQDWVVESVLPTIRKTGKYDIESDSWLKDRINFLENQNNQLVSEYTNTLKLISDKSRKLASNSITVNCDLNDYRDYFRKSRDYNDNKTKSKSDYSKGKYTNHIWFGDLDYLTEQLNERIAYEQLCDKLSVREKELKKEPLRNYKNLSVDTEIENLMSYLVSSEI